jgi:DNA invertase Pin-like site-specific DNA recombinase
MRQDKSTEQQLTEIQAYCGQHALILRHRFVDVAKSGGTTAGRDDFNRMIDLFHIPDQRPRGLILWNYARFARDIDDAQLNKIVIRKWGITVHSLNDHIPEGDYGRFIEFFIDMSNEEKRKQTSLDAKRGLKDLVEKYGCVPGTPPRGFKRTPVDLGKRRDNTDHIAHRWDPDPDWTPHIKQAFALKAAGSSLTEIHKATRLYNSLNSYRSFFQNKLYIGILEFADLTLENYCRPIIDRQTWDAVQRILALHADLQSASAKNSLHPRRRSSTYLLSGIAYCARCDSPLWGMTSGQRDGSYYRRYACTRAKRRRDCDLQPIPAKALEREVISKLTAFFDDPGNMKALLEEDQRQLVDLASQNMVLTDNLKKRLKSVRRSITNVAEAIAERKKSKALLAKLTSLEGEETDLQSQLLALSGMSDSERRRSARPFTSEEITFLSKRLVIRLQSSDSLTVRTVLQAIVNKLIVDRTHNRAFGALKIHSPREPETSTEDPPAVIITASMVSSPVGAHLHTRSISFEYPISRVTKKLRSS